MWKKRLILILMPFLLAVPATAHKGAQGVVKQRMKAMTKLERALRPVRDMAHGKRAYDATTVARHAHLLQQVAVHIPGQFPEGSLQGPSEASPAIWTNFADFSRRADELRAAAAALKTAAPETLPTAYRRVMRTCKGCHEKYRIEKD